MSLNVENLAKQGKITAESVLGGVTEDDNDNVSTAAGSEISEEFCSICLERKGLFEMAVKTRCKSCDALRHRIDRVGPCAADGSSCLDKFNNISNVARADFFKKNAHKFKDEFRREIETVVKMISTSVVEFGREGTGELMDSPDLKRNTSTTRNGLKP